MLKEITMTTFNVVNSLKHLRDDNLSVSEMLDVLLGNADKRLYQAKEA